MTEVSPVGVVLECPGDEWCAVGVNLDCANLAAVVVGAAHVEVADGCAHRCAALRDLLSQPFRDFGGEIAAVELGNGGHDAVDEHPRRRLINRLGGRDEGDPGCRRAWWMVYVVGAVAGEAVEFVHNTELHPRGGDECEHLL